MQPLRIMLIRHAEKPADPDDAETPPFGVDQDGNRDQRSLTPFGWQRAGALVPFFAPDGAPSREKLISIPAALFAPSHHGTSHRSRQTLEPLARARGLLLHHDRRVGEEAALVEDLLAGAGPALVAWEHKALPRIPALLTQGTVSLPRHWPADRFDLVWILDRDAEGGWSFAQVSQSLLGGDSARASPMAGRFWRARIGLRNGTAERRCLDTRRHAAHAARQRGGKRARRTALLKIRRQSRRPRPEVIARFQDAPTGFLADCMDGRGALDWRASSRWTPHAPPSPARPCPASVAQATTWHFWRR